MKKILCVHISQTPFTRIDVLNWLCLPDTGKGKLTENYWIFNTDTEMYVQDNDIEINQLNQFFLMCRMHDYSSLMLIKNGETETDQHSNSGNTTGTEQGDTGVT